MQNDKKNKIFWAAASLVMAIVPAFATEGGLGRTIPGAWIMPQAGAVPGQPGFTFSLMPMGYKGEMTATRQAPISGQLALGVNAAASINYVAASYVYKTNTRGFNISSSFVLPIQWTGVDATLSSTGGIARSVNDSVAGVGDIFFSPLTAGWHFSEYHHLSMSATITAPTGAYQQGRLANNGLNNWTVMPTFSHTYLWAKRGLMIDNTLAIDVYTENQATHYKNAPVFHWDGMLTQFLSKKAGVGVVLSNLTQTAPDKGDLADRLGGFKGHAWGAGPNAFYTMKAGGKDMTLMFRWIKEFQVQNRPSGSLLIFALTVKI